MLFISHRGNLDDVIREKENSPEYVTAALEAGFLVMVDVWLVSQNTIALGYSEPRYLVTLDFLKQEGIICHARSIQTLHFLLSNECHVFHTKDLSDGTGLSSQGLFIMNPLASVRTSCPRSIVMLPEWIHGGKNVTDIFKDLETVKISGICSSFIQRLKSHYLDIVRELMQKMDLEEQKLTTNKKSKQVVIEEKAEVIHPSNPSSNNSKKKLDVSLELD